MCQDGKIPLEKFIEILEEDPVWKESVPKPLKDKIIDEVFRTQKKRIILTLSIVRLTSIRMV